MLRTEREPSPSAAHLNPVINTDFGGVLSYVSPRCICYSSQRRLPSGPRNSAEHGASIFSPPLSGPAPPAGLLFRTSALWGSQSPQRHGRARDAGPEGRLKGRQQWSVDKQRESQDWSKMVWILKTALCESSIPSPDKSAEKWIRRAAKGLCFIPEYKTVSEIMQHMDNICLIGMRDLLTWLRAVFVW